LNLNFIFMCKNRKKKSFRKMKKNSLEEKKVTN